MRFCPARPERWALAALALLSAAAIAHPHEEAPAAESAQPEAATLDEAEVERLAQVLSALRGLRAEQARQRAQAEDRAEAARLAADTEARLARLLQRHDMDPETFRQLRRRLASDAQAQHDLRRRMDVLQREATRLQQRDQEKSHE